MERAKRSITAETEYHAYKKLSSEDTPCLLEFQKPDSQKSYLIASVEGEILEFEDNDLVYESHNTNNLGNIYELASTQKSYLILSEKGLWIKQYGATKQPILTVKLTETSFVKFGFQKSGVVLVSGDKLILLRFFDSHFTRFSQTNLALKVSQNKRKLKKKSSEERFDPVADIGLIGEDHNNLIILWANMSLRIYQFSLKNFKIVKKTAIFHLLIEIDPSRGIPSTFLSETHPPQKEDQRNQSLFSSGRHQKAVDLNSEQKPLKIIYSNSFRTDSKRRYLFIECLTEKFSTAILCVEIVEPGLSIVTRAVLYLPQYSDLDLTFEFNVSDYLDDFLGIVVIRPQVDGDSQDSVNSTIRCAFYDCRKGCFEEFRGVVNAEVKLAICMMREGGALYTVGGQGRMLRISLT